MAAVENGASSKSPQIRYLLLWRQHHGQPFTQAISPVGPGDFFDIHDDVAGNCQHGGTVFCAAQLVTVVVGQLWHLSHKHPFNDVEQEHAGGGQRALALKTV